MTNLVQVRNLKHSLGGNELFAGLDLVINSNDRIGLVGHNGSGKSTLMSLIAGRAVADGGDIQSRRGLRVREVEQFLPDALADVPAVAAVESELWRAEAILGSLGFSDVGMQIPVGDLSGGQQNRLMFARAVVDEPDLLLLDEPTNHLDLATIVAFQTHLDNLRCPFMLVSHDRAFLDAVTTRTLVLRDMRIYSFSGPYTQASDALLAMDDAAARSREAEDRKIEAVERSAKRLSIWGKVYDNKKFARKAKNMQRRAERMKEQRTFVSRGSPLGLAVEVGASRAREVVRVVDLPVQVASTDLFHIDELLIRPGDRIALLGHNGVGKSTFIRALMSTSPGSSEQIRVGPQTTLGYYDQELNEVAGDMTMAVFLSERTSAGTDRVKKELIGAGFAFRDHDKRVGQLSGGERARLLFLALSIERPNFLVLDEPTNHIDIEGKEQLEEQLIEGAAAVLLTSHDRRFIETVAERYVWIREGRLVEINDPGEFFASKVEELAPGAKAGPQPAPGATAASEDDLLERIEELEHKLAQDRARKPKFRKPALQAQWQAELEALYEKI